MRSEQRSRPSPASSRSGERAAPLWTARRTAARPRIACRSRFAALYLVHRCLTCVWRIADLCRKSVIRHTQVALAESAIGNEADSEFHERRQQLRFRVSRPQRAFALELACRCFPSFQ